MEKYARQAINDGVTSTEELSITRDCELYRALNMHYNKANDFEVGTHLYFLVLSLCCFLNLCSLEMASNPFLCWHFTETSPSMVRSRTSVRIPRPPWFLSESWGTDPLFFLSHWPVLLPPQKTHLAMEKGNWRVRRKWRQVFPFRRRGPHPKRPFFILRFWHVDWAENMLCAVVSCKSCFLRKSRNVIGQWFYGFCL